VSIIVRLYTALKQRYVWAYILSDLIVQLYGIQGAALVYSDGLVVV
jgi:predicted regulator of Ras-like GTPase activity (Roadblock/LC7/MglB family)